MATPEGKVKEACKRVFNKHGVWYFMPIGGPYTTHGIPDFVCCWQGRFLTVETKAPGKRANTTPNQKRVMEEIKAHNGIALVVDDAQQLTNFLLGETT